MHLCGCEPKPESGKAVSLLSGSGRPLPSPGPGLCLAIASVPMQLWETPYDPAVGLKQGTIFPSLDLPFFLTGGGTNG